MKNLILLRRSRRRQRHTGRADLQAFLHPRHFDGEHHPRSAEKRHGNGPQGKAYTEAGRLVPDDVVIGIIRERLAMGRLQKRFHPRRFPENHSAGRGSGQHGRCD